MIYSWTVYGKGIRGRRDLETNSYSLYGELEDIELEDEETILIRVHKYSHPEISVSQLRRFRDSLPEDDRGVLMWFKPHKMPVKSDPERAPMPEVGGTVEALSRIQGR